MKVRAIKYDLPKKYEQGKKSFTYDIKEKLKETFITMYEKFPFYQEVCKNENITKKDLEKIIDNEEFYKLPGVWAESFKRGKGLIEEINDKTAISQYKKGDVLYFQMSSSTSGDPSYVLTNEEELRRTIDNFSKIFKKEGVSVVYVFMPSKKLLDLEGKLGAYKGIPTTLRVGLSLHGLEELYNDVRYYVNLDFKKVLLRLINKKVKPIRKDNIQKVKNIIEEWKNRGKGIGLGGFSLLLDPTLDEWIKEGVRFDIGDRVYIILGGGGYSGRKGKVEGKAIIKKNLVEKACEVFGINKEECADRIIDTYAFTEQQGAHEGRWNWDLEDFLFTVGDDTIMYIIDPETGKPITEPGKKGLIKVITYYLKPENILSCNASVIQRDLAMPIEVGERKEVIKFTGIERQKGASIEGCAFKGEEILGE